MKLLATLGGIALIYVVSMILLAEDAISEYEKDDCR